MAVPTITIGGTDRTTSVDLYSIRLSGSGMADSETLEFDISDPTNAITVADGATVNLTESGGALTFGGFVQVVTPIHTALGRALRVSCISKGILLDRLLVPSLERSAGESDYTRIVYLLSTYGTGLSSTYTSIATINASMPAQTFAAMTLRSALESVAALASSTGKFYVDATGKLHYYSSVPTAAPYEINVGTPGAGEIAPEAFEVQRDSTGIVNAYYVQGANDLGSGWVTDATSIATYGRRESYLSVPDADTSAKRDTYGAAALALTKDPIARGTFTVSSPYDGWAQEQTVTVTSTQDGLSAATFVIQKVNRTYKAPSGDRTYSVEFGGALPRFSSANPAPASIPGRLITPGSMSLTPFASNIRPVAIVSSLPTLPDPIYPIGSFVYNTGDTPDTLYKTSDGTTWIKAVGPGDIQADSITAGQIAAGAISASEIAANAVTAGKIAAGAVSADTLLVGDVGNTISDPGFETGGLDWWVVSNVSGGSAAVNTTAPHGGIYRAVLTTTGTGNQAITAKDYVPCGPGELVSISIWAKIVSGSPYVTLAISAYDSAKGFLSTVSGTSTAASAAYAVIRETLTTPASTAYVRMRVTLTTPTATVALDDAVMIRGGAIIDSGGIAVTNGAITVTNAGSTVIIDGTSNMFKIVATGTLTVTESTGDGIAESYVSLSGLGTQSVVPAHSYYWSVATGTTSYREIGRIEYQEALFAASTSGGSPTFKFSGTRAYAIGLVNLDASSYIKPNSYQVNRTGSSRTFYSRYYIFKEASI